MTANFRLRFYTNFWVDEGLGSHGPGGHHFFAHLGLVRSFFRKARAPVQRHLNVGPGLAVEHLHVMNYAPAVPLDHRLELMRIRKSKKKKNDLQFIAVKKINFKKI